LDTSILSGSPPFVDEFKLSFIPDPNARWASFSRGDEIDSTTVPSAHALELVDSYQPLVIKGGEGWQKKVVPRVETLYVMINNQNDALANTSEFGKATRCAIVDSTDWAARNRALHSGQAVFFDGIVPPTIQSLKVKPRVHRSAKLEFPKANLLLVLGNSSNDQIYSNLWMNWMVDAGWERKQLRFRPQPNFGALQNRLVDGDYQVTTVSWAFDVPSGMNILGLFYGRNIGSGNTSRYQSPEFDRLYEQALLKTDIGERLELERQMNQLLVDDCAVGGGMARQSIYVWHARLKGVPAPTMSSTTNFRFLYTANSELKR